MLLDRPRHDDRLALGDGKRFIGGMMDRIITGNSLDVLRSMPPESVDCCVTSPPYYGLRNYGVEGQLGLEKSPEEYIKSMVEIFSYVRNAMKKQGTLWLNIGDTYANRSALGQSSPMKRDRRKLANLPWVGVPAGYKAKDLMGIPWMLAIALRSDGWYLRQDIIWHKPNTMPESMRDRCTKAHEYIFLLSKSERYYFDQDAIREPAVWGDWTRRKERESVKSFPDHETKNGIRSGRVPYGWDTGPGSHRTAEYQTTRNHRKSQPKGSFNGKTGDRAFRKTGEYRIKRSVWTVPTRPFKGAHFATFPEALIDPCIKAGCPMGGVVLDPFFGAGTVGVVAKKNARHYIGIELNPEYVRMAQERIDGIQPAHPSTATSN